MFARSLAHSLCSHSQFLGYVVITAFLGITEIPIIVEGIDQLVRTTKKEGLKRKSPR